MNAAQGLIKFLYLKTVFLFSLTLFFAGLTIGCQTKSGSLSEPWITGGEEVMPQDPIALATAAIVEQDQNRPDSWFISCSGTLVDKNLIITAAHCITQERVFVQFPGALGQKNKVYEGTAVIHEKYGQPYNEPHTFDLALIQLDQAVPATLRPLAIGKQGEYRIGDEVFLAGFGVTSKENTEASNNSAGKLYQTKAQITDIFQMGDEAKRDDLENYGLITYASRNGKSGACTGDSGGPLLIKKEGVLKVIGATAGGYETCNSTGKYTHLDFYRPWLTSHGYKNQ